MPITVTREAVKAERDLARKLKQMQDNLIIDSNNLKSAYYDNRNGLGAHSSDVEDLLDKLQREVSGKSNTSMNKMIRRLKLSAKNRQAHIESSIYRASDNGINVVKDTKSVSYEQTTVIPVQPTQYVYTGAGLATGWCKKNSMKAVSFSSSGQKIIRIPIGDKITVVNCSLPGIREAYILAKQSGDATLTNRVSAMYQIEALRDNLSLSKGDKNYTQLGGYHRDVKAQDPKGYQSHHIPARSVQAANADNLPVISITNEDHKLTSSYSGKQKHKFRSFLPNDNSEKTYKEEVSESLQKGEAGYISVVINELYDIKACVGDRYDGAISAYLDAVIDLLATDGIPDAKSSKGQT